MIKEFTVPQKVRKKFIRDIYVNRECSWLLFNKRVLDQSVARALQVFVHLHLQSG